MSQEERFNDPRYVGPDSKGNQKPFAGKLYETAEESYAERQLRLAKEFAKEKTKDALKKLTNQKKKNK